MRKRDGKSKKKQSGTENVLTKIEFHKKFNSFELLTIIFQFLVSRCQISIFWGLKVVGNFYSKQ